jgi:hypothetical protein
VDTTTKNRKQTTNNKMSKTTKVTGLFVKRGAKEEIAKRSEYADWKAGKLTKELKAQFTKTQVSQLLAMVERDEALDEENPDEFFKAYESIKADLARAAEHFEAEALAEAEAKAKAEAEKQAKKGKELALVESVKEIQFGEAYAKFTKKFDLGENMNQCVPRGKVTEEDLVGALALGFGLENMSQWVIGDIVCALENMGYENVVIAVCERFKKAYPTVSGYARVSRHVPVEKRDSSIPFTVYREIANARFSESDDKNLQTMHKLIDRAVSEGWGAGDARSHVEAERGVKKDDKKPGLSLFVVSLDNPVTSYFTSEVPKYSESTLIVDLKAKKFLEKKGNKTEWSEFFSDESEKSSS